MLVLAFYISLSAVWTFISGIAANAGSYRRPHSQVWPVATLLQHHRRRRHAALIGARFGGGRLMYWGMHALLLASVALLVGQPLAAALRPGGPVFKFTWTFVLPFILAGRRVG